MVWINVFFMGGGKVFVNVYYCSVEVLGVWICYDMFVDVIEFDGECFVVVCSGSWCFEVCSCVLVVGGFEFNCEWLCEVWG